MKVNNILLVEDDAILLFVNEKMLTQLGFTNIFTARTADEAIATAEKCNPDVILMDIRLIGDDDGIYAMEKIRNFSQAPVIYLSGNSDPATFERAKNSGMHAFLTKPVSLEMLKETLAPFMV